MPWPLSQDYNEAIQDMASSFGDTDLKQGEAVTNALGIPMPRSGNFADVYEVTTPKGKWAVKCFTRQIPGLRERYREVSAYLKRTPLPFMVDFSYLEQGIRVRGDWYPVLKMQWVEGFNLNQFVKDNADKPTLLDVLCQIWVKLAAKLTDSEMAHCDLQHGNVLLVPGSKAGSLAVKLVDYDGVCVPALTLLKTIEVGHPNFQHPQRARDGIYSLDVDRFSHLVIYTAVRALMSGGKALWEKYDNGDNLLFKASDFEKPAQSPLLAELLKSRDGGVRQLAATVRQSLTVPLANAPLLAQIAPTLPAPGRTTAVTRSVPAPPAPVANNAFAGVGDTVSSPRASKGAARPSSIVVGLVAGILGLGLLLAGAGAAWFFLARDRGRPDTIAQNPPTDVPEPPAPKVPLPKKTPPVVNPPIPADPVVARPADPAGPSLRLKANDRVELANSAGLLSGEKFTVEAWVKLPNPAETKGQVQYSLFGYRSWQAALKLPRPGIDPPDRWSVCSFVNGGGPGQFTRPWQPDAWHHVAFVWNAGEYRGYLDGKSGATGSGFPPLPPSQVNFALGMIPEWPHPAIGEFRAFRASSSVRYRENFAPPKEFTKDDDTVVLLEFTGKGTALRDLAGDHHGKITGGEWIGTAVAAIDPKPEPKPEPLVAKPGEPAGPSLRLNEKDHITLANSLGILRGDKFTAEAWVKLPNPAETKPGMYCIFGSTTWHVGVSPHRAVPVDRWSVVSLIGTNGSVTPTPTPWQPNVWHHLACVRTADGISVYLDGKPAGKMIKEFPPNKSDFFLGTIPYFTNPTNCEMHAFRASSISRYDRPFTPPKELTKDDDTVVLLEFTGKGKTLKDLVGDHDGKIVGGEWAGTGVAAIDPKPEPKPESEPGPGTNKPHAVQLQEDAYIELANTAGLIDWNRPQTVELLLRLREPSQRSQCQVMGEYSSDGKIPYGAWTLFLNCGGPKPRWSFGFRYNTGDSDTSMGITGKFPLSAETWHHVSVVRKPPSLILYVDGQQFWQREIATPMKVGNTPLCIGGGVIRNVRGGFDGDIAGVRISNKALYENNFVAQKQFTKDADTVLLLQFPGKGTKLKDLAGDHDGRLTNGKWLDEGPGPVAVNPVKPEPNPKSAPEPEREPDPNKKYGLQLGQESCIELANSGGLVDWNRPHTLEMFVRLREPRRGLNYRLVGEYSKDMKANGSWGLNINTGGSKEPVPQWMFMFAVAGRGAGIRPNAPLAANIWHHVAIVRRPQEFTLFVNGKSTGPVQIDKAIVPGTVPLCIGGGHNGSGMFGFDGDIAGFRISKKALYQADFVPRKQFSKTADTVVFLHFSGKGTNLKDLVGDHDGRITNGKWIETAADPVAVNPVDPEPEPRPEAPAAYLSDMREYNLRVGEGRFGKKGNLGSQLDGPLTPKIRVNGKLSGHGLSIVPDSDGIGTVKYRLFRRGGKFVTSVALDDSVGAAKIPKPATFVVLGDNKILWESNPVDMVKTVQECSVDVTGVQYLELRVMCTGANAQGVWLEPRIVGGQAVPETDPNPMPPVAAPANELPGGFGSVENIAVSSDGNFALIANQKAMVLWDLTTRRKVREFAHESRVHCVAFSSDGKRAFSGSGESMFVEKGQPFKQIDCTLRVWDVESGEEVQRFDGHLNPVSGVAVNTDGTRLVSTATRDAIRLWDLNGKKHRQLPISDIRWGSRRVALSPDGKVLIATENNTVCAAQMPTGKLLWRQPGHTSGVSALAMTADGRFAASGGGGVKSENGELTGTGTNIILWDTKAGRALGQIAGHSAPVHALAFSKDGKYLVSGAGMIVNRNGRGEPIDCTVRIWDTKTRKEVRRFEGHTIDVRGIAFYGEEGRKVISGDAFGKIRLWDMDADAPDKP